jgi:hypothetical protein
MLLKYKVIASALALISAVFLAFPAGYLSAIASRSFSLGLERHAIGLIDYYFKNEIRYDCSNTNYYGYMGGFNVIIPVYAPEPSDLLLLDKETEAVYLYASDIASNSRADFIGILAKHNTMLREKCSAE